MNRSRRALALFAFALAAVASYAAQRLWDARTEPPLGAVVGQAAIPYFWRIGFSAVHGAGVAALTWLGVRDADPWLRRLPSVTLAVVLAAVVAMVLVP